MDYQLVIFDWQGTLVDYNCQFIEQLRHVAVSMGLSGLDDHIIKQGLLGSQLDIIQTLYPNIDMRKQASLNENLTRYRAQHTHDVCLYPDARSVLQSLFDSNVLLAIATSASARTLKAELGFVELADMFVKTKTPDHTLNKPAPDMLNEIMAELGVDKDKALMVGDAACDFEAACHAGIDFIGVHIESVKLKNSIHQANQQVIEHLSELIEK